MTTLHIDLETRSPVDLKKAGVYVYAEHPDTDVWCAAYAFDDGPVELWTPGQPCPLGIVMHVATGGIVMAHNASFERTLWRHVLAERYGWLEPEIEQWRCTMAMAYALALPGSLDNCAAALGLDVRKDDAGYRGMLQMSRPRKRNDDGTYTWWDDDERKARLYAYCKQDVIVEREIERRLLPLRPFEQRVWQLDQKINDLGVYVDVDLCEAAKDIAEQAKKRLDRQMRETTANAVTSCTNGNQLREWLNQNGIACESVAKDEVSKLLSREDLAPHVRRALELRQAGSKTSTAKADALLNGMNRDGRARGLTQYHAASTGRWGGRRFQPQNLKRPDETTNIEAAIEAIKTRDLDVMLMLWDDPISIVGDTIRGMVTAAPRRMLRAADFSNIEGRVLAWLAGEDWKLDAFRAFDRGEGADLYKVTAGNILDKPAAEVTKLERQNVGKVSELALGYQGGVGAMMTMSGGRVDFAGLYDMLAEKLPQFTEGAADAYVQRGQGVGLSAKGWQAAEIIKLAWRSTNPNIQRLWADMEAAAIAAVADPGGIYSAGRCRFRVSGSWLFMQLPSGRCLAYAYPRLTAGKTPWGKDIQKLKFMGVDSVTGKWGLQETYGGKLVENATQAVARDVLAEALVRLDDAGWPIVLHVHDEAVTETPVDFGSTEELEQRMSSLPVWAQDLPVSAEGWSEERYRK
jgi:DNA polymerase bacteriophage-type